VSENCEGSCGEGFWLWPRRRGPSIPNAGCKDRANAGHGQKTRRPEGFRAKGRLASLLLSRRSREDILLRCASPSGLWRENRTPRNFRTRSERERRHPCRPIPAIFRQPDTPAGTPGLPEEPDFDPFPAEGVVTQFDEPPAQVDRHFPHVAFQTDGGVQAHAALGAGQEQAQPIGLQISQAQGHGALGEALGRRLAVRSAVGALMVFGLQFTASRNSIDGSGAGSSRASKSSWRVRNNLSCFPLVWEPCTRPRTDRR